MAQNGPRAWSFASTTENAAFECAACQKVSATEAMAELPESSLELTKWGPFSGAMSRDMRYNMERPGVPIVCVAGGSALGYLIDAVMVGGGGVRDCVRTPAACHFYNER